MRSSSPVHIMEGPLRADAAPVVLMATNCPRAELGHAGGTPASEVLGAPPAPLAAPPLPAFAVPPRALPPIPPFTSVPPCAAVPPFETAAPIPPRAPPPETA